MAKYTITTSIPYRAQSPSFAELPISKEPWLHVLFCSICKEGDKNQVAWYALTYVWDTREIVDWKEVTGLHYSTMHGCEKALDNDEHLKDSKHLLPAWMRMVCKRKLSKCTAESFEA